MMDRMHPSGLPIRRDVMRPAAGAVAAERGRWSNGSGTIARNARAGAGSRSLATITKWNKPTMRNPK